MPCLKMVIDENNPSFKLAIALINTTDQPIFIGGKAGTGKTTFLRSLQSQTTKKIAITASTGVAAINAGGVTLHSLFNFPLVAYVPENFDKYAERRLNANSRKILDELDVLVIDEASMLRSDTLDAIDSVLRKVRKGNSLAFGGVQIVLIGDLLQLPPVLLTHEKPILFKYYKSELFVNAKSFELSKPVYIKLEKPYRQRDQQFIDILNAVRDKSITPENLKVLNEHYRPGHQFNDADVIYLTTHNGIAAQLNAENFDKLADTPIVYEAIITGEYDEDDFPTERYLSLKTGAKVMLLKNDNSKVQKYYNGKIGIVEAVSNQMVTVRFNEYEVIEIKPETWVNSVYKLDTNNNSFKQQEVGTFQQMPLRLAWAITIHKSQGLTFDRAIVDVQRAFACGQVYVALSRLKSLDDLLLKSPVVVDTILVHPRALEYLENSSTIIAEPILEAFQELFFKRKMMELFLLPEFRALKFFSFADKEFEAWGANLTGMDVTISKFSKQFIALFPANNHSALLEDLISRAVTYFKDLIKDMLEGLDKYLAIHKADFHYSRQVIAVKELQKYLQQRAAGWNSVGLFINELKKGVKIGTLLSGLFTPKLNSPVKRPAAVRNIIAEKKSSEEHSLNLFKSGNSVNDISQICKLTTDTIENHLASFIKSGEINIYELISEEGLETVKELYLSGMTSLFDLKRLTGNKFSLGQIKAVTIYLTA